MQPHMSELSKGCLDLISTWTVEKPAPAGLIPSKVGDWEAIAVGN